MTQRSSLIREFTQKPDQKYYDYKEFYDVVNSDLPFKNIGSVPDTYTSFRKDVEARSKVRRLQELPPQLKPLPSDLPTGDVPDLEQLGHHQYVPDKRSAFPFKGELYQMESCHHHLT